MEMEMRATEDIEIGEDITPPLPPLTSALHDSFLLTHCSSCFSPLSDFSSSPSISLRYCSAKCSDSDSITSGRFFSGTADLRASLRLLHRALSNPSVRHSAPPERIFGLLTNRQKLMLPQDDDDDEVFLRIRNGAKAMAASRMTGSADGCHENNALEEAILCLVLTNAVDVQNSDGRTIGIAVYDPSFSWINHSCSPNACYRFLLETEAETNSNSVETRLRIAPSCTDPKTGGGSCNQIGTVHSNPPAFITRDFQGSGPRVVLRSIKSIRKGEAVTIAYCDLLQPKAMRQSELWSRYHFVCCCLRCSVKPQTYVDLALQEISAFKVELFDSNSITIFYDGDAVGKITDYVDDAISEYVSVGSPESCCKKLENVLTSGFSEEQARNEEGNQLLNLRLHPLHYLSLNAYTALASAYKVRSSDLLALGSKMDDDDENIRHASTMSRTSAAYSLFLAAATHHLFLSEPSLIASAANCWVVAGESMLILCRSSSFWAADISKWSFPMEKRMCSKCTWIDSFNSSQIHIPDVDFHEFSVGTFNCIANISQRSWSFLTHGCPYLKAFTVPFDFNRPKTTPSRSSIDRSGVYRKTKDIISQCEPQGSNEERQCIFELGMHCLIYGAYLASLCYGHHSHLGFQIQNILDEMK